MSTVAVVIPTIPPRTKMLRRALASVLGQARDPDAVVVAVDHDAAGAGPTRNRAWRMADTEYVATLDDDDEFLPGHLGALMSTAERTGADVVYSWFHLMGWPEATPGRPDPLAVKYNGQLRHPLGVPFGDEQAAHMRQHAFLPITGLIRRSLLEETGGCPTPGSREWPRLDCEDWGMWLRLLDAGAKFVHHPERTWRCHFHAGSTAGRPWKQPAGAR